MSHLLQGLAIFALTVLGCLMTQDWQAVLFWHLSITLFGVLGCVWTALRWASLWGDDFDVKGVNLDDID